MAYPSRPDFTASAPDAFNPPAWWAFRRDDGSLNVCATTGAAVVRRARQVLGLSSDPIWDSTLQSALLAQAQQFDRAQPGAGWSTIVSGLAGNTVSSVALQFAIWLAYYQPNGLRLDAIGIQSNAVLPSFGVRLPTSGDDALTCFDPQRDPSPDSLATQADLQAAQGESSAGIRLHPGESLPSPTVVPPGPSGLSTAALIGIGVVAIGAIAAVAYSNRKARSPKPKKNPSLRRRRR